MRSVERIFWGLFGLLLAGTGIHEMVIGEAEPVWRYVGGAALAVLGANAVLGAATGKPPWVSRIGPLP